MLYCCECHNHHALGRRCWRFANERGAAVILAVYFSAMTLLLLSSVAMTRTTTDLRAAQRSRDQIQAVYLAEAGVDRALAQVKFTPFNLRQGLSTYGAPAGTSVLWATIRNTAFNQTTNVMETVVEVLATGCPTGSPCPAASASTRSGFIAAGSNTTVIEALIRTRENLTGKATALGQVGLGGLGYFDFAPDGVTINGELHVASGRANALAVYPGTTIATPVLVNPADPPADGGYLVLESTAWQDKPAAIFWAGADPDDMTVLASPTPLEYFGTSYPELPPPDDCDSTPLLVNGSNAVTVAAEIADGGTRDYDPAVGHVTLCVPYVEMTADVTLTLNTATSLYTTSTSAFYPDSAFTNWGVIRTDPSLHARPDRGLAIIIADGAAYSVAYPGYADGSVYNPSGGVLTGSLPFNANGSVLDLHKGYIVGDSLWFEGVTVNFPAPIAVAEPVALLSWRQYRPPPPPPPPQGQPPPGTWAPPPDTGPPGTGAPPGTWAPPGTPPPPGG